MTRIQIQKNKNKNQDQERKTPKVTAKFSITTCRRQEKKNDQMQARKTQD